MTEFEEQMLDRLGRIADELNELVNVQKKLTYKLFGLDGLDPGITDSPYGLFNHLIEAVEASAPSL